MSCSRCGQSARKPVVIPPSGVTRPGSVYYPPSPSTAVPQKPLPTSAIESAITGLRYVPPSK